MAVFQRQKKEAVRQTTTDRTQVKKVSHGKLTWFNFEAPTEADLKYLQRRFTFHPLDFEDVRSTRQRPKVDEYDQYLFIIFHVPVFDRRTQRLIQEEVDVFIGDDYLVTLHSGRIKILDKLFDELKKSPAREEYMTKGSGFLLYELVSRLFENSFPMLDKIAARINELEETMVRRRSDDGLVEQLSKLKLEIINFRRIIRPQRVLIKGLEDKKKRFLPENLEVYFDDIEDAIERSSDLLDNYKEVVESLEDTNETFIQHRTNNVVKVLTLISLITLPISTVAAVLGMNLSFPFASNTVTFWISVIGPLLFVATVYLYMFYRRWL